MKKTTLLLFSIILLSFTACGEKKSKKSDLPVEHTTEFVTKETSPIKKGDVAKGDAFILKDIQESSYAISIENKKIYTDDIKQPIILINLFATWCPPCEGQIPYLSDIQKKYKKNLFVIGILVNDPIDTDDLQSFIIKNNVNYFISNSIENKNIATTLVRGLHLKANYPLPLTIVYKKGEYVNHYEGAIPIEMLNHDIQNLIDNKEK